MVMEKRDHLTYTLDAQSLEAAMSFLKRYCVRLTGSIWEAEDLVQDTLIKALPLVSGEMNHMNPYAYLCTVARNQWLDQVRRQGKLDRILAEMMETMNQPNLYAKESLELEQAIQCVLVYLSPLQRCVFLLRDVMVFSSSEVAHQLNMTEGAVKSALHRARRALQDVRTTMVFDQVAHHHELNVQVHQYMGALDRGDVQKLIELMHNECDVSVLRIEAIRLEQVGKVRATRKAQTVRASVTRLLNVYAA
ncbi:RNA polymerase sigma-70 factor (ECF subfamily) [Paenibacillus shirakamiensis]|uniref:RNA polymerase sigma factor n=1 Tax=Paenibacillus shirakamiensis TaxID=1265935 RepID=A0ABS4JGQ6_9BACL|nr:RNA polymerase sigma factor [Paenibacillus shirakamiensis]MBP2000904.1 RNA polymerase sigma-70 factor (ECF subfamily) [Paenibacillus shirakamiensis]